MELRSDVVNHNGSRPEKAGRCWIIPRLAAVFRDCARGSVAIELALLAPVLAAILLGSIDLGSYIYEKMQVQSASRAGAQYAIQSSGNSQDPVSIAVAVRASSTDLATGTTITTETFCGCSDGSETAVSGTTGCGGTCSGGEFPALSVRVTVTNTFTPIFPYPGIPDPVVLTGVTSLRVP